MAERRMFAKTIIDSDAFLDMPLSTQALYFHLSMRADDEGFINNPKKVQKIIGASEDDLKLLIAKNYVIPFDSGVVVIKHWKIHNYIRSDRLVKTKYTEERSLLDVKENGAYTISGELKALEDMDGQDARKEAYRNSYLPYSFDYKIRQAFTGKPCPVCGAIMRRTIDECGIISDANLPTVQHNLPISKGGKHELGNISVICHKCNVSLQDTETDRLNADEVIEVWERLTHDGQLTDKRQADVCIGKDSIDKDSIDKVNNNEQSKIAQDSFKERFEYLWDIYPNKKGKKRAFEAFKRAINKGTTVEQIRDGIKAYAKYIKESGIDMRYVKQGSTFFAQESWNDDWTPEKPKNGFNNFEHNQYDFDQLEKEIVPYA